MAKNQYLDPNYTKSQVVATCPPHLRPIFDNIRAMRPDLRTNSKIFQEAVKHYLVYLKSGDDPLVGALPQPLRMREKVEMASVRNHQSYRVSSQKSTPTESGANRNDNALSRLSSRNPHRKGVEWARIGSGGAPVRTFRKDGFRIDVFLKPPLPEEGAGVIPEW